jgi:hypothetical protein
MREDRRVGAVGAVVAAGALMVTALVTPAAAGDAKTTFHASALRHTCANPQKLVFHVTIKHAIPHATYLVQATDSPTVGEVRFKNKGKTTFRHREVVTMQNGRMPSTKTTVYFTLYHHKKHTNMQLNFSYSKKLPACHK